MANGLYRFDEGDFGSLGDEAADGTPGQGGASTRSSSVIMTGYAPVVESGDSWDAGLDFIPFEKSDASDSDRPSEDSEWLSDDEKMRNEARWMDVNEYWRVRVARNDLRDIIGNPRPCTPEITGRLNGESPQSVGSMVTPYMKSKAKYFLRRQKAIGRDVPVFPESPLAGYQGDREWDDDSSCASSDDNLLPVSKENGSEVRRQLRKELVQTDRYCMFNTGSLTREQFWKYLKEHLSQEILRGVVRVQSVRQPNGNWRMDFWIERQSSFGLKRILRMTAGLRRNGTYEDAKYPLGMLKEVWKHSKETKRWRLDLYRSWRERLPTRKPTEIEYNRAPGAGIVTINANGLVSRRAELINYLHFAGVGIAAVQETLMDGYSYKLAISGFAIYERPKDGDFRGQALLVDKRYPSYAVGKQDDESFIHIKVARLSGSTPWHIISVYFPSGGNFRSKRTQCLHNVMQEYKGIIEKESDARVVILGDFNMPRYELRQRIRTARTGLSCLAIRGSGLTFHRKGSNRSDIDSMLVSPSAKALMSHARVVRNWTGNSDHDPLQAKIKQGEAPEKTPVTPTYRFDPKAVQGHGHLIVHHNRWDSLPVEEIRSEEQLNEAAVSFAETINAVAMEAGIKQQVIGGRPLLNRVLKRKADKVIQLRLAYERAAKAGSSTAGQKLENWECERRTLRLGIAKRNTELKRKEVARVATLLKSHEMKAFHRWEERTTHGPRATDGVSPLQGHDGKLVTTPEEIRQQIYEHYRELHQDDEENLSHDKSYWKGKAEERREQELEGINEPVSWRNVLLAVRALSVGTSPGHETVPPEVYKVLLKEECHTHLKAQGVQVGDNTYVALPADKLPEEPVTSMGKQLYRIVKGVWDTKSQPEFWSRVTMRSLIKPGPQDPTDLKKSYRGVSLIVIAMKIVTTAVAQRLSQILEREKILVPEQGGFRPGEEAVAQFVTLAEIVRRRRVCGKKTIVTFIDFFKAFDKVMHEALFEKMDAMGIRGQLLELIRSIYLTSKACVKVGDVSTEYFDIMRGVRQGCPLSPLLFTIFINDFLKHVPKGVEVPCVREGNKHCPALLFADDIAGLSESTEQVHEFLKGVETWSKKWKMPVGVTKCGVMLVGGTEEEQEEFKKIEFQIDGKQVAVVRKYKYLGIIITDRLGGVEMSDEIEHCKLLAHRIKTAVNIRRAFLRDKAYPIEVKLAVLNSKIIPLGLYGGEWVGFCQERTSIIQKEVNVALRLILMASERSSLLGTKAMCWELGVPTVEERMAALRMRLYQKAPTMKSWIARLTSSDNTFSHSSRKRVWSSQTSHMIKGMLGKPEVKDTQWWYKTLVREGKMQEYPPRREVQSKNLVIARGTEDDWTVQRDRQQVKLQIIQRSWNADLTRARVVRATETYIKFGFGISRNWVKVAVQYPSLTEGCIWLSRLRTSSYWTTRRRWDVLVARSEGTGTLQHDRCPCCLEALEVDLPESFHILFSCKKWAPEREKWLRKAINILINELCSEAKGNLRRKDWKLEMLAYMLGGKIEEDVSVLLDGRDDEGSNLDVLTHFILGWGASSEFIMWGFDTHIFAYVAAFLASVMPRHKAALFPEGGSMTDSLWYETSDGERSPVKKPRPQSCLQRNVEGEQTEPDGDEFFFRKYRAPWRVATPAPKADAPRSMARRAGTHAWVLNLSDQSDSGGDTESE